LFKTYLSHFDEQWVAYEERRISFLVVESARRRTRSFVRSKEVTRVFRFDDGRRTADKEKWMAG
jgi:hypothetical protein